MLCQKTVVLKSELAKMWLCSHCESVIDEKYRRCVVCGRYPDEQIGGTQFCIYCGTKYVISDDNQFCIKCGNKLIP